MSRVLDEEQTRKIPRVEMNWNYFSEIGRRACPASFTTFITQFGNQSTNKVDRNQFALPWKKVISHLTYAELKLLVDKVLCNEALPNPPSLIDLASPSSEHVLPTSLIPSVKCEPTIASIFMERLSQILGLLPTSSTSSSATASRVIS